MSKFAKHEPENVIREFFGMGITISSQSILEDKIFHIATQYGWQLVPGSRNKIFFDAYGYRTVTAFKLCENKTEVVSTETKFTVLPGTNTQRAKTVLILLLISAVLFLPEWCLGMVTASAVIYVATPVVLRNRHAKLDTKRFVSFLETHGQCNLQ